MMKKNSIIVIVFILLISFTGCNNTKQEEGSNRQVSNQSKEEGKKQGDIEQEIDFSKMIEIKGSDTMVNLGQRWAEEFMNQYDKAQVSVTGGGSGTGIAALINQTADIAQSSRSIKEKEKEQAKGNGVEVQEFIVGQDGIALIVNKENEINQFTLEQLKQIFTGQITNWSQLGGMDAPIVLYSRESNSGTYAFFKEFVLEDEEYAQEALLLPSNSAIVEGIKQDKNGIGYVGLAYVNDEIRPVPVAKEEGNQGILPSLETINTGAYPVARPLYLYTAGEPKGAIKTYMDFIMGEVGQKIVEDIGFIPLQN